MAVVEEMVEEVGVMLMDEVVMDVVVEEVADETEEAVAEIDVVVVALVRHSRRNNAVIRSRITQGA